MGVFSISGAAARLLTIFLIVAISTNSIAQDDLAERVEASLERAIEFLRLRQEPDGGWTEVPGREYGVTALCTLALLTAGKSPDDAIVAAALEHLDGRKLEDTYCIALQSMVFCVANPRRYASQIEANTRRLIKLQENNGGWGYGEKLSGAADPSNSQFALLGLHEAQRSGVTGLRPEEWSEVFKRAQRYWERLQNGDGGFSYSDGKPGRGSMTCAGIASLVIVGSQLGGGEARVQNDEVVCCGNPGEDSQQRIELAFNWLARRFSIRTHPGHTRDHLYYMYALERAGRLAGRRFVGEHDWYREGAKALLSLQNPTTGQYASGANTGNSREAETAFGILFLAKGKRQLVVSRLQYGGNQDWNRHAPAIPNLTAHTELAWKRDLTWQNVVLERTSLQELLDTPVLFISGTRPPQFNAQQKKLLKDYVDNGGFIFAEGCVGDGCDGSTFEAAFNALVEELFEKPLTRLPPEHPVWTAESRLTPGDLPEGTWLYGVESCCRLGVVYCPSSLSCRWSLSPAYGAKPNYSEPVQAQLDNFTKVGLNVLAYATGRELKEKLDLVTVLEDKLPPTQSSRNILFLPVLRHNAGADDVPMAAPKLLQWLSNEFENIHTNTEKRLISITESELQKYAIAFIHGRGKLELTESQRLSLKTFLASGGFLIASSICGDTQFSDSFRAEMATVLEQPLEPINTRDPMLTDSFGGFDIRQLRVIDPDSTGESIVGNKRSIVPRLELGRTKQRISVVFSPLDISCALESRHSLQCKGYIREDAARLGINLLLFAMQNPD